MRWKLSRKHGSDDAHDLVALRVVVSGTEGNTPHTYSYELVDRYDEDWRRLAWVMLHGRAEILSAGGDHDRAQSLLRSRYRQLDAMRIEPLPVIAIHIERVASWGDLGPLARWCERIRAGTPPSDPAQLDRIRGEVRELTARFPAPGLAR